ncbi:MAG TPA: T9SS type A sorting domain-containing protein, partial [bacterium]|nr:T9SS type A sorting domain-containing protein [bacterium]
NVLAEAGSYNWEVPENQSSEYKIRVSDIADSQVFGISNGLFEILMPFIIIEHEPITVANENDTIVFNAVVTGNSDIEEVKVYYDKTGERAFENTLPMTVNGNRYEATLSSGFFTGYGIEYFIKVRDINGLEARYPEDGLLSIQAQISNMQSTVTISGGSAQNAYRMISVPIYLNGTTIVEQLSGKLPPGEPGIDWRLFRWSPSEGNYREYPNTGEGFMPGNAFWLIFKEGNYNLKSLEGTTVSTDNPLKITLLPGWNDIGDPWLFPISWAEIENPANANLSELYMYEGAWSEAGSIHTIEPWKGYAVRNNESISINITLKPNPATGASKTITKDKQLHWKLSIKAFTGEAKDIANYLGVRENAEKEWDIFDHVEPPPIGEYVSVSFPHYDWKDYPYVYTVDFRPPESTILWDFDVKTNIPRETVTVKIEGIEDLPEEYYVKNFDRDSKHAVYFNNNIFKFVSGKNLTERHFRLIVSDSDEPELGEYYSKPERFVIAICYPNPFNPQTIIQYELSMPGTVTISIFNSLGQIIRKYDIGHTEQGVHEFVFDAKGLTSGLYFYHIDVGYASTIDKMLFIK